MDVSSALMCVGAVASAGGRQRMRLDSGRDNSTMCDAPSCKSDPLPKFSVGCATRRLHSCSRHKTRKMTTHVGGASRQHVARPHNYCVLMHWYGWAQVRLERLRELGPVWRRRRLRRLVLLERRSRQARRHLVQDGAAHMRAHMLITTADESGRQDTVRTAAPHSRFER